MNYMFVASTVGERTAEALQDSLIGMLVVFLSLSVLWAVIEIFHFIIAGTTGKKENNKAKKAEKIEENPTNEVNSVSAVSDENTDNGALIAAITAAVSVCIDAPVGSFRVVSFRKTKSDAHWNKN